MQDRYRRAALRRPGRVTSATRVGSALWMARTLFVDCRPFLTVGIAGQKLGYCRDSEIVIGLPVATTSKNPYVDIHHDYHVINMEKMIDTVRKTYIIPRQAGPDYRLRRLSGKTGDGRGGGLRCIRT